MLSCSYYDGDDYDFWFVAEDELRPCPFCGNQPTQFIGSGANHGLVRCVTPLCPAGYMDWAPPKKWNTRPIEDALCAQISALEETLMIACQLSPGPE